MRRFLNEVNFEGGSGAPCENFLCFHANGNVKETKGELPGKGGPFCIVIQVRVLECSQFKAQVCISMHMHFTLKNCKKKDSNHGVVVSGRNKNSR